MVPKYYLTYHAVERLKERFSLFCSKIPELKTWQKEQGLSHLKPLFDHMLAEATENRAYLNNTAYMIKLYDKYGYDAQYCFLEFRTADILFVLTKHRSENHYRLVTLMPTNFRPHIKNIKYSHKLTKEDKYNNFIEKWYASVKNLEEPIPNQIEPPCSDILKPQLVAAVLSVKTTLISRLSHTKSIHKMVLDGVEYEFIYAKSASGEKDITLNSSRPLSQEEKAYSTLQLELSPEILAFLKDKVLSQNTEIIQKVSNTRCMHRVVYNKKVYDFLYIKTSKGDRNIELININEFNK